jgi:hypothetical protein
LDLVLQRARDYGVKRMLLTAGTLTESRRAVQAVREWRKTYPAMHLAVPSECIQRGANKSLLIKKSIPTRFFGLTEYVEQFFDESDEALVQKTREAVGKAVGKE